MVLLPPPAPLLGWGGSPRSWFGRALESSSEVFPPQPRVKLTHLQEYGPVLCQGTEDWEVLSRLQLNFLTSTRTAMLVNPLHPTSFFNQEAHHSTPLLCPLPPHAVLSSHLFLAFCTPKLSGCCSLTYPACMGIRQTDREISTYTRKSRD